MAGMLRLYESYLTQANYALHRMRIARADTMDDFSVKDPEGFSMMVAAMLGLHATISPELIQRWNEIRDMAESVA